MEDKILIEDEELIEEVSNAVPEELKKYLSYDEESLEKLENILEGMNAKLDSLNQKKIDSEKEFAEKLIEYKEKLEKEKQEAIERIEKEENEVSKEKEKVESIKLKEQGNQVNYIDSLKSILNEFGSKISSIEDAIKACGDNDTLTKALEEEKVKLDKSLESEYDKRKEELNSVLNEVGLKEEKPVVSEINNVDMDVDLDIDALKKELDLSFDNEVVDHEKRADVIQEIYESEDVMEGHVFPYLKSVRY